MIQPTLRPQFVVCTVFHDPPLVKDHDTIGVFHRPHPIMPPVEGLGVEAVQVLHAPDETRCRSFDQQMVVVIHQAVGISCPLLWRHNVAETGQWTEGNAFSGVQSADYWSATTFAGSPDIAWLVNLSVGLTNAIGKGIAFLVWPVRGGAE
jgi:hypothetical protein